MSRPLGLLVGSPTYPFTEPTALESLSPPLNVGVHSAPFRNDHLPGDGSPSPRPALPLRSNAREQPVPPPPPSSGVWGGPGVVVARPAGLPMSAAHRVYPDHRVPVERDRDSVVPPSAGRASDSNPWPDAPLPSRLTSCYPGDT